MATASTEFRPHEAALLPTQSDKTTTRVLHLVNGEHYAGAERVQDLLGLRLPEFGFEASYVCLKPNKFPQTRIAQHVPCDAAPMAFRFDLRPALKVARMVRDGGFALLHTHTPRSALIGRVAAAIAGVPVVHHIHSPTIADSTRRFRDAINAIVERQSIARISAAIAVSQAMAQYARRQGIHPARIHVVSNGVPIVGPLTNRTVPSQTWTLGIVALFRPRKGLEVLLESLALLRQTEHDVRLRAVGTFESPEYLAAIVAHAAKLGVSDCVEWTGFSRNVQSELSKVDLLVLPSLFGEGLPMVVLEAMASGVPVVATRVEGIPEAVRDGIDGVIANPNDAADLSRAVGRVIGGELDWSRLRQSAHARQAQWFSDECMARGVAEVYRKVLSA